MQQVIQFIIGIFVLGLGIPLGNLLAKLTKEELASGQRWFKLIVFLGLGGGVVGLIISDDILMFSCFFISIAASQNLKIKKRL